MLCSWKEVTRGAYFMLQNVQDSRSRYRLCLWNETASFSLRIGNLGYGPQIWVRKDDKMNETKIFTGYYKNVIPSNLKSCHQTSRWLSSSASRLISYLINQIQGRWQKIYYTVDSITNTSIVKIWCEQVHLEKRHCRIRFSSWHKRVFESGGRGCSQQGGPTPFQYLMETPQRALTRIWQNKYTTATASKVVNNRRARSLFHSPSHTLSLSK